MKVTGIITEYNPFHLGHKLHLESAKKNTNCDGIVCIMSGNFMQRGMPALIDKWNRAKIAVLNGVDLVIELPLVYSISSAEGFAQGAVKILNSTNIIDYLYFGAEHDNLKDLCLISKILFDHNHEYTNLLKIELSKGLPFHSARSNALNNILGKDFTNILNNSNNILAIEYIKALYKYNSQIEPKLLKREGALYNEKNLITKYPSATSIRNALYLDNNIDKLKDSLPIETFDYLNRLNKSNYKFVFSEDTFDYLKFKILTCGNNLSNIPEATEGLDNKIIKEIVNSNSLDELILNIKSKRYTYTRISRILTSFFIGLENYDVNSICDNSKPYIRPLAFNDVGRKLLKEIKTNSDVPIITKIPKKNNNMMLNLDLLGTKAYSILNSSISPYDDYLKSPYYI